MSWSIYTGKGTRAAVLAQLGKQVPPSALGPEEAGVFTACRDKLIDLVTNGVAHDQPQHYVYVYEARASGHGAAVTSLTFASECIGVDPPVTA